MPQTPWSERIFRALLRIFPAEFRGDFGDQMAEVFRDQREDAHRSGRWRLLTLWARTIGDALGRGPREHLDILRRDAGYAVRLLRRRPGLALSAVMTLAVGIGLNATVFSLVNSVLWRGLELPGGERLVRLYEVSPAPARESVQVSADNFTDWQAKLRSFDVLALLGADNRVLIGRGDPEEVRCARVSRGFFGMVPLRPTLGRLLTDGDFQAAASRSNRADGTPAPTVAVIAHSLWVRQFASRPDVIGSHIRLGQGDVEIVGVLDEQFSFPGWDDVELWLPEVFEAYGRRARFLSAYGHLAAGVSVEQAQVELDGLAGQLAAAYPAANAGYGIKAVNLLDSLTVSSRRTLWLLLGAAACVLLIACANVANLLLSHASGRRLELATRVALGATRAHLVRQALTEGLLLALIGGSAGIAIAVWAVPILVSLAPAEVPRLAQVTLDARAITVTAILSLVVGLGCGALSCLAARRIGGSVALRTSGVAALQGRRFRQVLIVSEIAVALMLVVAAGLLVRTWQAVNRLELGFDPQNTISIGLTPDFRKYRRLEAKAEFEADLLQRVRMVSGVVAAGIGRKPLASGGFGTRLALAERPDAHLMVSVDVVGPGYLEALGTSIVAGRRFDDRDVAGAPLVALVNRQAAARWWPGTRAVGRRVIVDDAPIEIVGVIEDVRRQGLENEIEPVFYFASAQQQSFQTGNMLVRTNGQPREVLPAIRAILRQLDPDQALTRLQTLEERLAESIAPRRRLLALVGLFSVIALGLALLGVYAVISEAVAQRVPEIGVRMALGATSTDVTRLFLRQGTGLAAGGLVVGLSGALLFHRVMASFLFRVQTTDLATLLLASMCIVVTTCAACGVPALRAARVDPVVALRQE